MKMIDFMVKLYLLIKKGNITNITRYYARFTGSEGWKRVEKDVTETRKSKYDYLPKYFNKILNSGKVQN